MARPRPGRQDLLQAVDSAMRRTVAGAVLFNHQVAEQLGLSSTENQFINLLDLNGTLTPGRLAELTGLGSGTVTGVLDRLEHAGFARRERDSRDRRRVFVSLDVARIQQEIVPLYAGQDARLGQLLERYPDRDLAVIADFLGRLAPDDPVA